jgi:nicotinamidase-related amidase
VETGLLLIDIQNDYFPGGKAELVDSTEAGEKARQALDWARGKGMPIFHVRHTSPRPGANFFLPGTAGAEIRTCVKPVQGEGLIEKHFPNSFRETALLDNLRQKQIGRLVVAGMMTHMCVEATVRAAADLGFECVVLHDACATKALTFNGLTVPANAVHVAYLAGLAAGYAKVISVEEWFAELS